MPSDRYFPNPPGPPRTTDPNKELLASLDRIATYNPPVHTCSTGWTFQGLYSGPTSIAYLFYRLSQIFPDLQFKQQSLLDWAEAYLALGARGQKKAPDPSHCGIANETLAHLALSAVIQRDASLARQLCSFAATINTSSKDGSNEWLYGRAGYLYFLRLCRSAFVSSSTDTAPSSNSSIAAALDTAIANTVARILSSPQPWTWHGKAYLGAAHGTIGIITQVVLSQPSAAPALQDLLAGLLAEHQWPSGNFRSSVGSESDRLVQFCHGGPGFGVSLASLAPFFPALKAEIEDAVDRIREDAWRRGVLTKAPCLCHGIAGNALVFDDDERFMHFLSLMSTEEMEERGWMSRAGRNDDFVGLYTGEAGRAWVWGVAASGGKRVCIGYNDL
ncbi:hypothetical protein F5Y04DRAFT_174176 [Hypomontagnella monticulosa]|nr:hypothetical protein F5Y04DRAFT_174176 [Hypomontagnella monticulosa]